MKTHEHAIISVGYGAVLAVVAGQGLFDPAIYVSALIGGELIDFIDHPLYQLVFARNDRVVKEARILLKNEGLRSAIRYLSQKEDERGFNKLLLHNILSLNIIALVSIFTSLYMPGTVYPFIMLGAFFLHMLTDIYGDFRLLGHFDNWLWILTPKMLDWFGKLGYRLVFIALLWWFNIIIGFLVITFRIVWQLYQPTTYWGLAVEAARRDPIFMTTTTASSITSGDLWLAYGPLLFLLIYFILLFIIIIAGAHKINLETPSDLRGKRNRFSTGSLQVVWNFVRGKLPPGRQQFGNVLLAMQSDQAVWILILTILIAAVLMVESFLKVSLPVILYTPVVLALIFGTLVHSTIGEFGGVQGILLATFLNLIFTKPDLDYRWPYYYGYFLFLAAIGAWVLGLLGGILLRENKRLSLISFVIRIQYRGNEENSDWPHNVIDMVQHGIETGYNRARLSLFGAAQQKQRAIQSQPDYLIAPHQGRPMLSGDYYHIMIKDSVVPLMQDIGYVLCDNRLVSNNKLAWPLGMLPSLPRTRVIIKDTKDADIIWKAGNYFWRRKTQDVCLPSCENAQAWLKPNTHFGLVKTWGELFDNLVTRKSTINTDLYLFATPDEPCSITLCGLTRTSTSTKDYATLEAEVYASEVITSIIEIAQQLPGLKIQENQSARIVYSGFAFEDRLTIEAMTGAAIFPTGVGPCLSKESTQVLSETLNLIPDANKSKNVLTDLNRRFLILATQLGLSFPTTFEYISGKLNLLQGLQTLINFLKGL